MKLHDPRTEATVLQIAKRIGKNSSENVPRWQRVLAFLLWHPAMIGAAIFFLRRSNTESRPEIIQQALCIILLMLTVRHGHQSIGLAFKETGFFSTLVNLPIKRRAALLFTRNRLIHIFGFSSIIYPTLAAAALRNFSVSADWHGFLIDSALLIAIVWSTALIANSPWLQRKGMVKFWHVSSIALIACSAIALYFGGGGGTSGNALLSQTSAGFDHFLWIFPPAWILPQKFASGGAILIAIWVALGLTAYLRWPLAQFPRYDRPSDFQSAFGSYEKSEPAEDFLEKTVSPGNEITSSPHVYEPRRFVESGWVEKLVARFIPPDDRHIAGAILDPDPNWTKRTNEGLIAAPIWLLAIWLGIEPLSAAFEEGLVLFIVATITVISAIYFFLAAVDPTPTALLTCNLGNTQVPFFSTLPISVRDLQRISERISIVRGVIAAAITTPCFWLMTKISGFPEVANGLLLATPVAIAAWGLFGSFMLMSRYRANTKRIRGTFFLHHATGVLYLCLSLIAAACAITAAVLAFIWAAGFSEERFVYLMLPAVIGCLLLSAVVARLGFELFIFSLHRPGYDWLVPKK